MNTEDVLRWSFEQNFHADKMNAAIHCAPVRFSPLTFRLYESLMKVWPQGVDITAEMGEVGSHHRTYAEDPRPMRAFHLVRKIDVTGVSGTGIVAEGIEFVDGTVALRWLTAWPTSVVFHDRGLEAVKAVHGHGGDTEIEILWSDDGVKVCVYAIMRDEESNIAAWAETTVDADRRFILDTGSTDGSLSEYAINGLDNLVAHFVPFRFDDARNCALALAPEADLYLRLDADERLDADWRAQIEAAYDPNIARYRYTVRNTEGIWSQITRDDLHKREGFRWKYPTHEVLIGAGPVIDLPRFVVSHTSPPERRPHHLTNRDVLYHAVQEYPGDHRMLFYLARECWYAGDWDNCRGYMSNFLRLPGGWGPERCEAYRILAAIDIYPERWLWHAIAESPERREPWVDLTRLMLRQGEIARAALFFTEAERRIDDGTYTTDRSAWGPAFEELREEIAHHLSLESTAS